MAAALALLVVAGLLRAEVWGMCSIRIGVEDTAFLVLTLHGRTLPDAADPWDADWLDCTAEVTAGAFRGHLNRSLRSDELERFSRQLARLYDRLTGEAVLETLEHWLAIRVAGDGRGHLEASCRLCDDPACGNTLDFRLHFDQTSLPDLLRQLEGALQAYPVIGH
jgi:hypothetical protein